MNKEAIMPFHLFNYHNRDYAINIEQMQASTIDEKTAADLRLMQSETEMPATPGLQADLEKLGLISEVPKKKAAITNDAVPIVSMALFVTQACNLQCVYCYEEKNHQVMEEKTAFKAVDWLIEQAGNMKKIQIIFFGGEPFLNYSLMKKVVAYAKEQTAMLNKTVSFSITTNATLLDDEKIAFMKEQQFCVTVSMDGSKEIQDKQRPFKGGHGSYDIIFPNIKKLLTALPDTVVHAVIVDDDKSQLAVDALMKMGFAQATYAPASISLFENDTQKTKKTRNVNGILQELEREADLWNHHIRNRDRESLKNLLSGSQLGMAILAFLHKRKNRYACGAGRSYIAVSGLGDIYLCHRFVGLEDYKLGNVFTETIDRTAYQQSPLLKMKECADCLARYYCAGGCKHENAGSCGSAFIPSTDICLFKKREVELGAVVASLLDDESRAFLYESGIFPRKPCVLDF